MEDPAREVVAMQFAGGMSIARLAEEWERDAMWVEESVRLALLESIPKRDGGMKISRVEARAARVEPEAECETQVEMEFL